jgi:hypothetical protein
LLALIESSIRRAFSTFLRAFAANIKFVFRVVFHPARNRDWICASWARRASPTFSSARAYFSSALASGSSVSELCARVCEPASEARAIAWLKVLGCGFAEGGAVRAAWASAGELACERSVTLSLIVRPRSLKDSRMLGG